MNRANNDPAAMLNNQHFQPSTLRPYVLPSSNTAQQQPSRKRKRKQQTSPAVLQKQPKTEHAFAEWNVMHDQVKDQLQVQLNLFNSDIDGHLQGLLGANTPPGIVLPVEHVAFTEYIQLLDVTSRGRSDLQVTTLPNTDAVDYDLINNRVENRSDDAQVVEIMDEKFVIPQHSVFYLCQMSHYLKHCSVDYGKFNCILMDPPWSNHSASRKASYRTSHHQLQSDLLNIPFNNLANSEQGCIVLCWVTNRPFYHKFLKEQLFPKIKATVHGQIYWMKMAASGEPVVPLDCNHRKPYECLFVAHIAGRNSTLSEKLQSVFANNQIQVMFGCPTKHHSQKPPMFQVISDLLQIPYSTMNCLELYARNLYHHSTSVGNEVLSFQNFKYFENIKNI